MLEVGLLGLLYYLGPKVLGRIHMQVCVFQDDLTRYPYLLY
jgi:hypothetical protein